MMATANARIMCRLDWDHPRDSDESETVAHPAVTVSMMEAAQVER